LQPKIHQISFGGWAQPRPVGGAYSAPTEPLAGFRWPTSKGREKRQAREGEEGIGEGKRGREVDEKGARGRGRGGE